MELNINIIGMGVVGQALYANMHMGNHIKCYDLDDHFETFSKDSTFNKFSDYTMIALPTPTVNNTQDHSIVCRALDILVNKEYNGIIVIHSTILYNAIEPYLDKLRIIYSPEFLSARHSIQDFYEQEYVVAGGNSYHTTKYYNDYNKIYNLKNNIEMEQCSIKEAIDFKYMRNIKQAYNLMFWEFVHDKTNNSEKLSYMMNKIPVGENTRIAMDGYRGYGQSTYKTRKDFSACLDKDIRAYNDNDLLLDFLIDSNEKMRNS